MMPIARVAVLGLLSAVALSLPPSATVQQAKRVPRIGYLCLTTCPPALTEGLRDLGYVENRNVVIERREGGGGAELLPGLAADLVRLGVDVIVTQAGMPPALAASLARPGGNMTGLSFLAPELTAKQIELFKEVVPKLSRVATLSDARSPAEKRLAVDRQAAARMPGLILQPVELAGPEDVDRALGVVAKGRPDGLYLSYDNLVYTKREQILEFIARRRLPTMSGTRAFVDGGGLIMYGPDWSALYRRSATYVDKILKGARPTDLPVEQPPKFLGLTIPQSVLVRADTIIE